MAISRLKSRIVSPPKAAMRRLSVTWALRRSPSSVTRVAWRKPSAVPWLVEMRSIDREVEPVPR